MVLTMRWDKGSVGTVPSAGVFFVLLVDKDGSLWLWLNVVVEESHQLDSSLMVLFGGASKAPRAIFASLSDWWTAAGRETLLHK